MLPRIAKLARTCRERLALVACRLRLGSDGLPPDLRLARGVVVAATDGGRVSFGGQCSVARNATLIVKRGRLAVGSRVHFGIGCVVVAREAIRIGDGVLIAEYVTIRDQDHDFDAAGGVEPRAFSNAAIDIGPGVWIGAKATITRGVTIGANSVIGSNSVVTRDIPPGVLAAGAPARVIRRLQRGEREQPQLAEAIGCSAATEEAT